MKTTNRIFRTLLAGALALCATAASLAQQTAEFDRPFGYIARQGAAITTQNLAATGDATAGSALQITTNGVSTLGLQVKNVYTGALSLQGTIDGVNWVTAGGTPFYNLGTATSTATIGSGTTGLFRVNVNGWYKVRIVALAAVTGTAYVDAFGTIADGASAGGSGGGTSDASAANQTTQIAAEQATQASVASIDTKTPTASSTAAATTNRWPVTQPDNVAITTSTCSANNCTLFTGMSTAGFDSFYFQNTTASGTYTVNLQGSVDGVTYTDLKCQDLTATGSTGIALTSTSTAAALIQCRAAPLIQAKVLAYTSGTITASAVLSKKAFQPIVGIYSAASLAVNAGQAAHDAAVSGNPVRVGCRGSTAQYATTIVNGDTVDVQCDLNGATVVKPYSVAGSDWNYAAAASGIVNTTTPVQMVGAAGASIRNYVTGCTVQTATLGGATELVIQDSTPTVLFRTQLQTTALPLTHIYFPTPKKGAANLALQVATLTAVTGGVYVNCDGYSGQ